MSAAHHVHPMQMSMFIPAGVLADPTKTEHGDLYMFDGEGNGEELDTTEKLRANKLGNAARWSQRGIGIPRRGDEPSLRDSIAAKGVEEPVAVSGFNQRWGELPKLVNGHHRSFTAADIDPKMEVPVKWTS